MEKKKFSLEISRIWIIFIFIFKWVYEDRFVKEIVWFLGFIKENVLKDVLGYYSFKLLLR